MKHFVFATGIECSYPVVEGGVRRDILEETGHYQRWRQDLALVKALGTTHLRYGPPLHKVFLGPGRYDWAFCDQVFTELRKLEVTPIVDLVHFGLPDWLGNFQNPEFPDFLAEYAQAFAERYAWVQFYTPVTELHLTAHFSAMLGFWNEQLTGDRPYVTALRHLCKASILIQGAINRVRPDAVFVQSETAEYTHFRDPAAEPAAEFHNQGRFAALDLHYGRELHGNILLYLMDNGLPREEYDWFMQQKAGERAVLGLDYYPSNEHLAQPDGSRQTYKETLGWYVIARQYYQRYHKPLMHTETNIDLSEKQEDWLWKQWHNVEQLRDDGVPLIGFTWYGLIDFIDWGAGNTLRRKEGQVVPCGLYDLDRQPRPAAQAYHDLIQRFQDQPILKDNPVFVVDEANGPGFRASGAA